MPWNPETLDGQAINMAYLDGGPNADIYKRLTYLTSRSILRQTHFAVRAGAKILGIASVEVSPDDEQVLWVMHVSVDPDYQRQGIARALIESLYAYAVEHGFRVSPSSFTQEGQVLKHIFEDLNDQHEAAASPSPFRDFRR